MQRLWAPWRIDYLEGDDKPNECFLCAAGAQASIDGLVVWRGRRVFALLNAYPYANGHVLIAPYLHEGDLLNLPEDTVVELGSAVCRIVAALGREFTPDGLNLGANLGDAAGAGVAEHLHLHVVPRWRGDTNFMTATAEVRVIPESLDRTAERLRRALALNQEDAE